MKQSLLTALLLLPFLPTQAQDVHFSQFDNTPIFTHVGQTGLFNGDYRLATSYRSQWFSVPVPYTTFCASFDARLFPRKLENDVFGMGVYFMHDKAGDSQLSTTSAYLSLAFTKRIAGPLFLFGGAYLGFGQRRFKTDKLTFDDQYNGDQFNSNIVSSNLNVLTNTSFAHFDAGMGLGFRWQQSKRTFANIGVNFAHINRPKQSFLGTNALLAARMTFYLTTSIRVHERLDLLPSFQYQMQFPYKELVLGSMFRYHLNLNPGRETTMLFGTYLRNKDAVIPSFGLSYLTLQCVMSYDINFSGFSPATNRNGGFEISLIYILRRIPTQPTTKICPIL